MSKIYLIIILFISIPSFSQRYCIEYTYESQIGVREQGYNAGEQVELYLSEAGVPVGSAWCASFLYWSFRQCDSTFVMNGPAWSPSWFPSSKVIYSRTGIDKAKPQPGDVIGIYFPKKERIAHVGFYDSETDTYFLTVEGNTNEEGSREGDGVYRKRRIKRQVYKISSWAKPSQGVDPCNNHR